MMLVLIRHGKAKNLVDEMDDECRSLTKDGRKELLKSMPVLKSLIGENKNLLLWTSPLLRATQSARIIADAFEIKEMKIYDFIRDGDIALFLEELSKIALKGSGLISKSQDCLILVGHQPNLSDWCYEICGKVLQFNKGCAVAINILSLNPFNGLFNWKFDPQILKKTGDKALISLGRDNNIEELVHMKEIEWNNSALVELISIMQYYLQKIQNSQKKFLQDPDDIENLHQIRVNIRKFRSLLSFTRPLISLEAYQINQDKMRKTGQLFARLRELDVLKDEWEFIVSKNIFAIPTPSLLSEILKKLRGKEKTKVLSILKKGLLTTVLLELSNWLSEISDLREHLSKQTLDAFVHQRTKKWKKNILNDLKSIDTLDLKPLHLIRIKTKKLRYVQEIFFANNTHCNSTNYTDSMKNLQERLGYFCDNHRNIEIIQEIFAKYNSQDINYEKEMFICYLSGKGTGLEISTDFSKFI